MHEAGIAQNMLYIVEDSELIVTEIPISGICRDCNHKSVHEDYIFFCSKSSSVNIEIISDEDVINISTAFVINEIDLPYYLNFDVEKCIENAKKVKPSIKCFQTSCVDEVGFDDWIDIQICG